MTVYVNHSVAPTTLVDVIANVKALFSSAANKTPILVGEQYLEANQGTPPRIVFLPETDGGRISGAIASGHACASWVHGCEVRIREKPGSQEEGTFLFATALADKVIAALWSTCTGRIEWGSVSQTSPAKSNSMGAEISIRFTFRRDVLHWDKLWQTPVAPEDSTATNEDTRTLAGYVPASEPTITTNEGTPVVTTTVIPKEG